MFLNVEIYPCKVFSEFGLVHTVHGIACHACDVAEGNRLLHGFETNVYGDAGYQGVEKR